MSNMLSSSGHFFNSPWSIGYLSIDHRLIQGPLAGFSCSPFRQLFTQYTAPSYCVSEMISAQDLMHKHSLNSRYLYRDNTEKKLCYQMAGTDPVLMRDAAQKLESIGADLIDINCGCPKAKIRKKGAGSALLEKPELLIKIVQTVRAAIRCPLTIKIRIQGNTNDIGLAKALADAGADALIIHGRRWVDDYNKPCNLEQIARIKQAVAIPIIANGDIRDISSLNHAFEQTGCDAYMISRAGTGKPWLFEELLQEKNLTITNKELTRLFMTHLQGLAQLETEYQAILQSKSLVRYYFKERISAEGLQAFYALNTLSEISDALNYSSTLFINAPTPIDGQRLTSNERVID